MYDNYSNQHDYDDMVENQVKKWDEFNRRDGDLFLFSYTLTSTTGGTIPNAEYPDDSHGWDCVLEMAAAANPVLLANLAFYKQSKNISTIPNILYIDKVSSHYSANEALYINQLFN